MMQILIIIQARTRCFCGNQTDISTFTTSNACHKTCKGNASQMCGGYWKLSIYQLGIYVILV